MSKSGLMTADELRQHVVTVMFPEQTHEQIGNRLGITTSFVGMVLSGAREPSKAFLRKLGFERVILYRQQRKR